ncbi:uncharacterized protein LOC117650776 [Thrips palmi]|uniref:Uncharacterized protein LOC117650776 n=1 Tax=Thrips palmi TaxID=161013 RepID=A0A6P8ZXY0_THRPL|nr:uncharacterized protein LOC117650776 [Thrips palmi]
MAEGTSPTWPTPPRTLQWVVTVMAVLALVVVLSLACLIAYSLFIDRMHIPNDLYEILAACINSAVTGVFACQVSTLWALGADLRADVVHLVAEAEGQDESQDERSRVDACRWRGLRVRQILLHDLKACMCAAYGVQIVAFVLGDMVDSAFSLYTNLSVAFASTQCVADTLWAVVIALRLVLIFVLCQWVSEEHETLSHIFNSFQAGTCNLPRKEAQEVKGCILQFCVVDHTFTAAGMLPMDLNSMKAAILVIISNCIVLAQFDRATCSLIELPIKS